MKHELKTINPWFQEIWDGKKPIEVRSCADRDFNVGDELLLKEWVPVEAHPEGGFYTSRSIFIPRVTYIFQGGQYGVAPDINILCFDIRDIFRYVEAIDKDGGVFYKCVNGVAV